MKNDEKFRIWEDTMNFFKKYAIAIVAISLACCMALPFSNAQARVYSNVMQLDNSGAYLGIQMDDVNASNLSKYKLKNERGAIVRSVAKGSPAEAATIKEDDVILEFGGNQVWSSLQLSRLVRETPVGRKVDLIVSRDGKQINLSAKLEKRESRSADNAREPQPEEFFGPGPRSFQFRWPDGSGAGPGVVISTSGKPRLGITIQPLTDQLGEFLGVPNKKGVLVSSVMDGSPSVGKLKSGDVITSFDGKAIENPEDLTRLIRNKSEGSVTLKVIRDKKEITVVVSLPEGEEKGYKL
jgi:serine protease Do